MEKHLWAISVRVNQMDKMVQEFRQGDQCGNPMELYAKIYEHRASISMHNLCIGKNLEGRPCEVEEDLQMIHTGAIEEKLWTLKRGL